jgi:hypothetical protein
MDIWIENRMNIFDVEKGNGIIPFKEIICGNLTREDDNKQNEDN